MKLLESLHLVQFSFFEADTFQTRGNLTILGPNGVGKTSILDAIQIAMLGAHGNYLAFNSQSVSSQQKRTLKDYCLGAMRSGEDSGSGAVRKRDHAQSYISLVFRDTETGEPISAGLCMSATVTENHHRLRGLFVAPGIALTLEDHLQAIEEGTAPLDWGAFEVELIRQAKSIGRTPHISTHPEAYVDELLHALQPSARHIDRHAFVRSFKKSMQLKDIENVNDFVRDYLIDAQPINKQSALSQIQRFRQLKDLIAETEEQIDRLSQIRKDHEILADAYRRRDTAIAVKALLAFEHEESTLQDLITSQEDAEKRLAKIAPEIETKTAEKLNLQTAQATLIAQIASDPASASSEQAKKLRALLNENIRKAKGDLSSYHLSLRSALRDQARCLSDQDPQVVAALERIQGKWDALVSTNDTADLVLLQETLEQIATLNRHIDTLAKLAKETEKNAEANYKSKAGLLTAQARGAGRLSSEVGSAIEEFERHGITAYPVCSLIEIKDRSWQSAIEAFLGRHREALVVEPGREREAVKLLRSQGGAWAYDVTIVQPSHIKIDRQHISGKDTVGALITGSNEVAIAYVRRILGAMRCVKTEEELERFDRSMTSDGMLSANGGTKRLRLISSDNWQIGSKTSESELRELHNEVSQAQRNWKESAALCEKFDTAMKSASFDLNPTIYLKLVDNLADLKRQLAETLDPDAITEPDYLVKLRDRKKEIDNNLHKTEEDVTALITRRTEDITLLRQVTTQIATAKDNVSLLQESYEQSTRAQDFDSELLATIYDDVTKDGETNPAGSCETIRSKQDRRIQDVHPRAMTAFRQFIDHYSVALVDERSDWRLARPWVQGRITKLETSELVSYKGEAEEALKAAESAFRSDVAYRLREAIQRLEESIKHLNKILALCPVFSSNERYRFEAKPAEIHKKIYEFIRHIDETEGALGSLFTNSADAKSEILQLLEASASPDGKKIQNPLEDYRLLFNFDLAILQDGKEVDRLSKRIGVASNGEHRVPFYVIAGAALTSAYRIGTGKASDGAALMLLDEAFYGMDSQNSYAAAEFLRSIGLQLIMAGPEADQGKLSPMTDTLYEMARYGGDVFAECEHLSESMHSLMTSDMPMLNPDLIDQAEARLTLDMP